MSDLGAGAPILSASLLERITDGVFVFDRDWRCTYVNRRAADLIGRDPAELLGRNVWELYPDAAQMPFAAELRGAMAQQQARRVTAHYPPLGMWFEADVYPGPDGLTAIVRDVTEQIEQQQALRSTMGRLRALTTIVPAFLWLTDAHGNLQLSSDDFHDYTGRSEGEINGWAWQHQGVIHPDDLPGMLERWQHSLATGEPFEMEVRLRGADGRYHWHLNRCAPIRDQQGTITGWAGASVDISARKQSEAREAALQRLTGAFTRALTPADVAGVLLREGMVELDAVGAAVAVAEADGYRLVGAAGYPDDAVRAADTFAADAPLPLADAARRMEPVWLEGMADWLERYPAFASAHAAAGTGRVATLPLIVDGRLIGVLGLSFRNEGPFDADERDFLMAVARACAQTLERARLFDAERTARERLEAALTALATSEQRLHASQQLSLDAFMILRAVRDDGGRIVDFVWEYVNPAAARILGHPANDLVGARLLDVLPSNRDHPDLFPRYARITETGEPDEVELRYESDGISGWFRNVAVKLDDGVAITFSDITARKEALDRLARLQALTADLAGALTPEQVAAAVAEHGRAALGAVALSIAMLEPDGQQLLLLAASGSPPEPAVVGRRVPLDLHTPLTDATRRGVPVLLHSPAVLAERYPDLAPAWQRSGEAAWAALPLVADGGVVGALRVSFADQQPFAPAERSFMHTLADACAQALERARLFAAERRTRTRLERLQAITDTALAALGTDDLLRELLVRLRTLLDGDTATILLVDAEGDLVIRLSDGLEREQGLRVPVGRGFAGRIAASRQPLAIDDLRTIDVVSPALRAHVRSAAGVPLLLDGRLIGVLHVGCKEHHHFTDDDLDLLGLAAERVALALERARLYDAERAARAEAEAANRAKDEFLSVLSHELRTPLTPLLGWIAMLQRRPASEEARSRGLVAMERSAKALSQLVADLLDVSRIVAGKLHLRVAPVVPADVIAAAAAMVQPAADDKGVTLTMSLAPGAGVVSGDADRLQQVIWNLLANAVKFTPAGGRVDIRLHRDGDQAVIEVADTGIGIKREFLPQVFDRFRQADSGSMREHGGLGLGLAIARHLVELHGGTIAAESAGVGRGATFTVRLPIADPPARAPAGAAADAPTPAGGALAGRRVLLVEDEADTRAYLTALLESEGAAVTAVATVTAARAALEAGRQDVLISDIGLPGEDGYALIAWLRVRDPHLPALALSAYASNSDRDRALAAGFTDHATKPVDAEALVRTVAAMAVTAPSPEPGRGLRAEG